MLIRNEGGAHLLAVFSDDRHSASCLVHNLCLYLRSPDLIYLRSVKTRRPIRVVCSSTFVSYLRTRGGRTWEATDDAPLSSYLRRQAPPFARAVWGKPEEVTHPMSDDGRPGRNAN